MVHVCKKWVHRRLNMLNTRLTSSYYRRKYLLDNVNAEKVNQDSLNWIHCFGCVWRKWLFTHFVDVHPNCVAVCFKKSLHFEHDVLALLLVADHDVVFRLC